ncbi:MAG TPA: FkbM family methyltransferase, partial [Thermodesulfobacteriota bacterium]|nr:FkbM family methyltransferase [Thermodesulfobacteriota bacterium]
IEATSIDEEVGGEAVTFIKMDVEGAEIEAIRGAENTMRLHGPKLAISAYHNTSDLYEIPLLLRRIRPEYEVYLRHFGNYFDDTVVLARVERQPSGSRRERVRTS